VQQWPEQSQTGHGSPRATLIVAANEIPGLHTNVWMGGARTEHGIELSVGGLSSASFLDLAGDLPRSFRKFSQNWQSFVFPDVEHVPPRYERLQEIVAQLHASVNGDGKAAPSDLYLMCTHGMNRSGLATGLLLRKLGIPGDAAISVITGARRGSLSNDLFRKLIQDA
jgi:hypothetical protein